MTTLGLTLLVLGVLVAVVESHYPTHGVLGGVGVLTMAAGAVLALSGLGAGLLIGLLAGLLLAGSGGAAVIWAVRQGVSTRGRRVRGGAEGLIGHLGTVRSWNGHGGERCGRWRSVARTGVARP